MQERYRALQDLVRLPAGASEALVYSPLDRRAVLVGRRELSLLAKCTTFATLHEHAARAQGPMVSATASFAGAVSELRGLVERGLLVSEQHLTERLRTQANAHDANGDVNAPPPITSIGIPTRGRAGLVIEAIESYRRGKTEGRQVEVVVAHDATGDGESQALIDALREVDGGDAISLRYAGPRQRADYAAKLARAAEVDPQLVAWALTRRHPDAWQVGVLRNALMLDAAGTLTVMIDDDVRSELASPPITEDGVALTSLGGVMEHWFPAPGRAAESLVRLAPADILTPHETLLGRSLRGLLDTVDLDVGDASAKLLRDALAGRGRVRCSQLGLAGDAATGSLAHLLMLKGRSRERLVVSEAIYDHAFTSRQEARGAVRRAVSDAPACMSYALGLDLRGPLPPFPPEGRNSDGVFGFALRHCVRDALLGYAPSVVAHRPPPRASSIDEVLDEVRQIDINDLVCRVVASSGLQTRSADVDSSFHRLGEHLKRLGELRLEDLEEMLRVLTLRTRSRDIAGLGATLASHHDRPAYWARDVNKLRERLRVVALEPDHTQPRDLIRADGREAGREGVRRIFRDYGRLLSSWPRLEAAARSLREDGIRPSVAWP